MQSPARKRTWSLDTDPDTKAGLVHHNTITTPPKKRLKATVKEEVVNNEQVTLSHTSKHEDDISMPHTPIRATKTLPTSQSDDEYQGSASPLPSPKPKPVKKARKAAGTKPKSPKAKKAAAPKPPKIPTAERKTLWVDWCNQHAWIRDMSYKPPDGDTWVVMHSVDAVKYFNFKADVELRVVPYYEFPNEKDSRHPGQARRYCDLLQLAYRKAAYSKGHPDALGEPGATTERLMLAEGKERFTTSIQRLEDRYLQMQDKKIRDGKLHPSKRKGRAGPKVYNTGYLPPPMGDEDGNDSDEELEDEDEYDADY